MFYKFALIIAREIYKKNCSIFHSFLVCLPTRRIAYDEGGESWTAHTAGTGTGADKSSGVSAADRD
jgi:hypothetical protein